MKRQIKLLVSMLLVVFTLSPLSIQAAFEEATDGEIPADKVAELVSKLDFDLLTAEFDQFFKAATAKDDFTDEELVAIFKIFFQDIRFNGEDMFFSKRKKPLSKKLLRIVQRGRNLNARALDRVQAAKQIVFKIEDAKLVQIEPDRLITSRPFNIEYVDLELRLEGDTAPVDFTGIFLINVPLEELLTRVRNALNPELIANNNALNLVLVDSAILTEEERAAFTDVFNAEQISIDTRQASLELKDKAITDIDAFTEKGSFFLTNLINSAEVDPSLEAGEVDILEATINENINGVSECQLENLSTLNVPVAGTVNYDIKLSCLFDDAQIRVPFTINMATVAREIFEKVDAELVNVQSFIANPPDLLGPSSRLISTELDADTGLLTAIYDNNEIVTRFVIQAEDGVDLLNPPANFNADVSISFTDAEGNTALSTPSQRAFTATVVNNAGDILLEYTGGPSTLVLNGFPFSNLNQFDLLLKYQPINGLNVEIQE